MTIKRTVFILITTLLLASRIHAQPADALPNAMTIPFHLHHGLIFVDAEINGQKGLFLFDSGAPSLIINKGRVFYGKDVDSVVVAKGVNGTIEGVGVVHVDSFTWGKLQLNNLLAVGMDFANLEKQTHQHFLGLIGYDVFKDYEVKFNYKEQLLTLRKLDEAGNYLQNTQAVGATKICVAPIEMAGHIPITKITIAGKEYKMGLDCGASNNLLYDKYYKDIKQVCSRLHHAKMMGAGSVVAKVKVSKVKTATICNVTFGKERTAFSDLSLDQLNEGYGLGIDGLLGYQFFKQHTLAINYKKKELIIYAD